MDDQILVNRGSRRTKWTEWQRRPKQFDPELGEYHFYGQTRGFYLWVYRHPLLGKTAQTKAFMVAGEGFWRLDAMSTTDMTGLIENWHNMSEEMKREQMQPYAS